ncbi:MAG: LysE family translocator [Gammaproteobacteria bacterium]|nr:LysE family translocator [Gammaproteobacteria bacterium]MDH4256764.1 LysE family translocator [Gammaproteobacteria bacterium]MDH5311066.1 LysE family translocator [Gammaproteobacteria bacterium]
MLDPPLFASLVGFAVISSITPGPNNLMLMSSAALFGWRRTVPHLAGVVIGFALLMASAVYGLGALVQKWPWLVMVVKLAGVAWLGWMAWQYFAAAILIASKVRYPDDVRTSRSLRFYEGLLLQPANPKALLLATSSAAAYVGIADSIHVRALIIVGVFFFCGRTLRCRLDCRGRRHSAPVGDGALYRSDQCVDRQPDCRHRGNHPERLSSGPVSGQRRMPRITSR